MSIWAIEVDGNGSIIKNNEVTVPQPAAAIAGLDALRARLHGTVAAAPVAPPTAARVAPGEECARCP